MKRNQTKLSKFLAQKETKVRKFKMGQELEGEGSYLIGWANGYLECLDKVRKEFKKEGK